ncbi:hypothetical protein ILUMI_03512 [Ignelater luminosus]|uniref:HTH CENPB-type domain-containing protein n=1 Tax=Ignelater luminosus TaxID=2038154 RepID=A0A8K0DG55_IGNLU|nr:hypothetical protein ILUMI_03512 [Ignelater luminosus]
MGSNREDVLKDIWRIYLENDSLSSFLIAQQANCSRCTIEKMRGGFSVKDKPRSGRPEGLSDVKLEKKICLVRPSDSVFEILSANKASKEYNIPKGTLINKLHGKSTISARKIGPAPLLSIDEENKLETWIIGKAKIGFPMHPEKVKDAVQKVLEEIPRPYSFKNSRPSDKWLVIFKKKTQYFKKKCRDYIKS